MKKIILFTLICIPGLLKAQCDSVLEVNDDKFEKTKVLQTKKPIGQIAEPGQPGILFIVKTDYNNGLLYIGISNAQRCIESHARVDFLFEDEKVISGINNLPFNCDNMCAVLLSKKGYSKKLLSGLLESRVKAVRINNGDYVIDNDVHEDDAQLLKDAVSCISQQMK